MSLRAELHAFADRIADEFEAMRPATDATTYDRVRLPPRIKTVRSFNRRCRGGIEGAYKENGQWVVPCDAWHRAVASPPMRRSTVTPPPANDSSSSSALDVDVMIRNAGYRLTRGAR